MNGLIRPDNDYVGVSYLRKQLNKKKHRVDLRYNYYEMKQVVKDFMISSPASLAHWWVALGWCGKAVDSVADRLVFRNFDNDLFGINEIFESNNSSTFFDSAVLSATISSCCFVYISKNIDGDIRLQVIDGGDATGIIDSTTGLLKEGYAVLARDPKNRKPTIEAHFMRGMTRFYYANGFVEEIANPLNSPLLVPIIYRPDARRPFGRSRISRACMDIVGGAMRTVKRSEISSEFYSFPQKYLLGTAPEEVDDEEMTAKPIDKWKATLSSMLVISKDEDGDSPKAGQFQQQSMSPHLDHLKMFATLFSAETGLTLEDLGFNFGNPTSAESIKASHENLRLVARKAQRTFNNGFLNVGFTAVCLRDNFLYDRAKLFNDTVPKWEPVFEPDASALSSYGDGVIKINQAIPEYIDKDKMRDIIGW